MREGWRKDGFFTGKRKPNFKKTVRTLLLPSGELILKLIAPE
jgi:hypothetical protein